MERRFLLNDRLVELGPDERGLALAWLRQRQGLCGTKEGCGEGECGACTVLLGELSPRGVVYRAVASCLLPVGELPGRHLVTIEGLNPPTGLNPIQQQFVDEGAPQCGFCFPGMVVSLTGFFLDSADLSVNDGLAALDGNICRCTGYAAIVRAVTALAATYRPLLDPTRARVDQLAEWGILPAAFATAAARLSTLGAPPIERFDTTAPAVLFAGGTDLIVQQPDLPAAADLAYLSRRPELRVIERELDELVIGGAVTIEEFGHAPEFRALVPDAPAIVGRFGSTLIRNRATVAGNLVNASPIGDVTILLLALGAKVVLSRDGRRRTVPLSEFFLGYKQLAREPGELVAAVRVPASVAGDLVSFEKVSQRRFLDIAGVNSAARIRCRDGLLERVTLAVGGVAPVPLSASSTAAYLTGRTLDAATALAAADVLESEIAPISDVRGSAGYKRELARRVLFAHLLRVAPDRLRVEELV
ncbi:MAG TPA: FAD binding domain-containing protein [Candidatus Krumholzibacteria bacterium]|nr:FAD binding domain-containing protein [Candidatus Krumholzibacteria bacterium]HPD73188.1 FAD binding domain-containing protein [Candidatus Krumholzibacteria bacterium]HRY41934.1 FAD binding domain-containing protein [Candidatus Krumholzibacteria bacterium]